MSDPPIARGVAPAASQGATATDLQNAAAGTRGATPTDSQVTAPVRAVVRYRLDPPPPVGQPPLTDAVGNVVRNDSDEIVLDTRRGRVVIPRHLVVATRIVPAPPPRRGVVGSNLPPLELHREAVDSWPPMERAPLGEWLLRASHGFTYRGNSVLPVGDPGLALEQAIDAVESWYAERGLAPNFTLAGPEGFDPTRDQLGALLARRGYEFTEPSLFLTAALSTVAAALGALAPFSTGTAGSAGPPAPPAPADPDTGDDEAVAQTMGLAFRLRPGLTHNEAAAQTVGLAVRLRPELTDDWLRIFDGYRATDWEAARGIMTGSPAQIFATATIDGVAAGVGRLGISGEWAGIAAMWVDPVYRRRGVARAILRELTVAAGELGATRLHLQALAANRPALALYRQAGFRVHHAYVNATRP